MIKIKISKDNLEFLSKISENSNFLGLIGDQIAFWRRKNASKIIEKARKFSEDNKALLNKLPSKFLIEFVNNALLEEDEDLQMLWAKILSGESERPNSFSLKTLEILKNMNRKEAEIFNNLTHFLVKYNKDIFLFNNDELLKKYNIIFDQLMILEEYGLITLQPFLSFQYDLVSTRKIAIYTNNKLLLIRGNIEKTNKNFSLKIYTLTTFGRQLFSVINWEIIDNFLYDAGKIMKKENKDIIVSLHEIKNIDTSSGQINYNRNDLLLQN